eukprot:scaffold30024_cov52-Cyclotella_meneghiniana.AAC.2
MKATKKEKEDAQWDEKFKALLEYKNKRYKQNPKLARWVSNQRKYHKNEKMSQDRIDKLEGIAFVWKPARGGLDAARKNEFDENWNDMFEQLKVFRVEIYKSNPKLGRWVHTQRQKHRNKKLSLDQIKKLEAIAFDWKPATGGAAVAAAKAQKNEPTSLEGISQSASPSYTSDTILEADQTNNEDTAELNKAELVEATKNNANLPSTERDAVRGMAQSLETEKDSSGFVFNEEVDQDATGGASAEQQIIIAKLTSRINELEGQHKNLQKERDELQSQRASETAALQKEVERLNKALSESKSDKDRQLSDLSASLQQSQYKLSEVTKEANSLKTYAGKNQQLIKELNKSLDTANRIQEDAKNQENEIQGLKEEIQRQASKIASQRKSLEGGQLSGNECNFDEEGLRNRITQALQKSKPIVKWDNVAGLETAKEELKEAYLNPKKFPKYYPSRCRGILLYGPPGTGKTYLAEALATETNATFFSLSSADLASKWTGESERLVQTLFKMARESPESNAIIFIDEIDALCTARSDESDDGSRKVLLQICVEMETKGCNVLVIAATNKPFDIDTASMRRFNEKIFVSLPNQEARSAMIKIHVGGKPNNLTAADYERLGHLTDGASGSDIRNLVEKAVCNRLKEYHQATAFRPDKYGYLVPCKYPNCPRCPRKHSNALCKQCGAKKMRLEDVPTPKIKDPVLKVTNFEKAMENGSYRSVATNDINMYAEFTEKYGKDGS